MAGHSKWAQIKRAKGAADVKRGVAFSKLANAVTIAARGGADPAMNFQLRIAIDKARSANMPKDNIDRAIARSGGAGGQAALEEITFEAYGPGGTAFLIETATDNRNRTVSEVKAVLHKFGAKLAESGAVGYLFEKKGLIIVAGSRDIEAAELEAIDAGADDVTVEEGRIFVYTKPTELEKVRQAVLAKHLNVEESSLVQEPITVIKITDSEMAEKLIRFSETLDELADVTKVESNFDIANDLLH